MQEFQLTLAVGRRGAVLTERFKADPIDPWPRAMQVISRKINKGSNYINGDEQQLTLLLTVVPPKGDS